MNALSTRPGARRGVQLAMLLAVLALAWTERQWAAADQVVFATIAGLGLLLLAGALISELLEAIGLPHLTGYLLAGVLLGPHLLNLIDHHSVEQLGVVNELALTLIALAGGAELRVSAIRREAKSLAWAHLFQTTAVVAIVGGTFFALRDFIPFLHDLPTATVGAIALLWGLLAATRSSAALLALMAQYKPKGPLTNWSVAFVMSSNLVIIVLLAVVMPLAQAAMDASTDVATALAHSGIKLVENTALGATLGALLIGYLHLSGRNLLFVLLLLGLPISSLFQHLDLDPLLTLTIAGFVVQNFSSRGDQLLRSIEGTADIVFVVFFATAGAHLDLPGFVSVWPIVVILVVVRIAVTIGAARAASRVAGDVAVVKRWGWSGLVSQAGLAVGIAIILAQQFPRFGTGFATLAIGVVGLNEILGPVLFKIAISRAAESHADKPKNMARAVSKAS